MFNGVLCTHRNHLHCFACGACSCLQLVILGTGAADYEARVKTADHEWGWFCRGHVGFSVPLGHKIMAGCDILLMPSRCVCTRAFVGIS